MSSGQGMEKIKAAFNNFFDRFMPVDIQNAGQETTRLARLEISFALILIGLALLYFYFIYH